MSQTEKTETPRLSEGKRHLLEQYLIGKSRNATGTVQNASGRSQRSATKDHVFPRVRELTLEDYPRVAELECRYGLGLKSYEQWSHIWLNNPVYHELRHNWPLGWVLEIEENQLVGAHGNIPLLYEFNGRRLLAAQGRALVVDSRYRGYSLQLLGAFFDQSNVELCLDTTASPESARADDVLGALRVPIGTWDSDAFWITNYSAFVLGWLGKRIPRRMSAVARPVSYPLSAGLFLRDRLTKPRPGRILDGMSVASCAAFDDRFDEFWEQLRKQNPGKLLAVRTRKILEWHFAYALRQQRLWIWTVTKDSRPVAYAIFLKVENPDSSVTRVALVDFQSLGEASLLQPMLAEALEQCRREGIHVLENTGLAYEQSGINKLAPYRRSRAWWIYFYRSKDRELSEQLSCPEVWNPSLYDGDASIL